DKNCRCSRQIFETARRVLAQNPQLFQKGLSADRESPYDVVARAFRDEEEEASWLLEDIGAERDVAILYRKHRVGELLEGRLLGAGIPCRLARGRSLIEDEVIRYVVSALRVVRSPDDPVALEGFARCVLSEHFFQEVQAAIGNEPDFVGAVRSLARRRPKGDPDTKRLWRLVYQVENLRALPRSHPTLRAVITEILSHGAGPFRNKLEERHDELSDPAALPEAVALAARLERAVAAEESIVFAPKGGVEIALRGMLIAAGIRAVGSPRGGAPGSAVPNALTLFKALQLMHSRDIDRPLERYVTFDFETTDNNVATCGVVEIGAVRVVNGEIVDRFHAMVNPYQPISPRATEVHGYTDKDVESAPPFS
ncbi:MAG: exonuclease domain-containing protein, partial [Gemmatimonadales bacterium]